MLEVRKSGPYQDIATEGIVIGSVSGREESNEWIELVLGEGLENSGRSDE